MPRWVPVEASAKSAAAVARARTLIDPGVQRSHRRITPMTTTTDRAPARSRLGVHLPPDVRVRKGAHPLGRRCPTRTGFRRDYAGGARTRWSG